jgi:alanyl aminopeptidase
MRRLFFLAWTLVGCASHATGTSPTSATPATGGSSAATPATPAAPDPKPPALRLPAGVHPTGYQVFLDIDPEQPTFRGVVHIDLQIDQPTRLLWLHGQGLDVKSAEIGSLHARSFAAPGGFLGLALSGELPAGKTALEIGFEGKLDSVRSQGIYRVKEPDGRWYVYTFFEPVDARRAFPCFDEPSFKVPWKLAIRTPASNVAAANTRAATDKVEEGHRIVEFEESKPLPSYLVAFVVGPFAIIDGGTAGKFNTPLRFIVPPGHEEELRFAREATPRAVGLLEDWFGMAYPYGKLDVAVVPRYWGTMEHPGIVAMGQSLTLIKPSEETLERKKHYANILIHELAHYWFGDYVTMAWWNETWLNEGMGEWMDNKLTTLFDPAWKFGRTRLGFRAGAMSADGLASAKALRQPVGQASDVESSFDGALTYSKGMSVLYMYEHFLGEEKFQKAIRKYLDDHKWGNVVSEDLVAAISAEAGRDLDASLHGFIDQPGVPTVALELVCEKGKPPRVKLAQKRFRPLGAGEIADATWQIPMCLRYGTGKAASQKCDLLTETSAEWPLEGAKACPAWVLGSADAYGYYRVAYTPAGRAALVKVARAALTPAERHGLVVDTAALVQAGELPLGELLALGSSFLGDPDFLVQTVAFGSLGYVDPDELPAELLPAYRRMIDKLLGAQAKRLGWTEKANESNDDRERRTMLVPRVARWGDDPRLRGEATRLARAWLADRKAVAHDLARAVLHVAAHFGDRALFDAYLAEARHTKDREDRAMLLGALASFADPALVKAAEDLALAGEFDVRDGGGLFMAGMDDPATREQAWTFVKAHFDELAAKLRDDEKSWSLGVARSFCDAEHRADAEAFFKERAAKINGGPQALARTLESMDECIAQRARNAPEIATFLKKF